MNVIIVSTTLIMLAVLVAFLHAFKAKKLLYLPLIVALLLFSIGFSLRLTAKQSLVDIGFFLTEASYLFATIIFAAALVMGQEKYWGG
jgi:hypothetical protein